MDVSGNPRIYVMFGFEAFIVKCAELGHACRSGEHCHVGHYMEPLARLCMCACNVAYIIMHLACAYVCVWRERRAFASCMHGASVCSKKGRIEYISCG